METQLMKRAVRGTEDIFLIVVLIGNIIYALVISTRPTVNMWRHA